MSGHFPLIDYQIICDLAAACGRSRESLIALNKTVDPFFLIKSRQRDAEWFAALYHEHGFGRGIHVRRIHYRLVSQESPIRMPNGRDYLNTVSCWGILCGAALSARYAGLIDLNDFVDARNPAPDIYLPGPVSEPCRYAGSGALTTEIPETLPRPWLNFYADCPTPVQVEIWIEKSTMNDVLVPLANRYGLNLQIGVGEISLVRCRDLVERAKANGDRPVRIIYASDFDPGGMSMAAPLN